MIKIAQAETFSNIRWLCAAANAIPLDGNSIDVALASMLLEHVSDRDEFFWEISRVMRSGGRFVIRTMLPEDIGRTSWYEFLPLAADFELSRTISLAEIGDLSAKSGFQLISSRSYTDEVESSVAKLLPERICGKSYEILSYIDSDYLISAACRAAAAVDNPVYKEYMTSSLVVLRKVESHV